MLRYFLLVFGLAVPFWLLGERMLPPPLSLPASAVVALVPATAAAALSFQRARVRGVRELVRNAWDYRKIGNPLWYVPALFLAPAIYLSSYAVMRLAGVPLPDRVEIPLRTAPVLLPLFLIGGAGEELGWTGFATDPVQKRLGAVRGALILGAVWALWHAIPFLQTETGQSATWVAWQSVKTIAMRVVMVWLYNGSGKSVFAVILYHVTDNLGWAFFPNSRSHYDPVVTGALTALVAAVASAASSRRPMRLRRNTPD